MKKYIAEVILTSKKIGRKRKETPWWTEEVKITVLEKKKAYQCWLKTEIKTPVKIMLNSEMKLRGSKGEPKERSGNSWHPIWKLL